MDELVRLVCLFLPDREREGERDLEDNEDVDDFNVIVTASSGDDTVRALERCIMRTIMMAMRVMLVAVVIAMVVVVVMLFTR